MSYTDTDPIAEQLRKFKRANKEAREIRARRRNYASAETYRNFLEGQPLQPILPQTNRPTSSKGLPEFHFVDVVDISGSMSSGGRIKAANKGVKSNLESLKKTNPDDLYTLTTFHTYVNVGTTTPVKLSNAIQFHPKNLTALCSAVCQTIDKVRGTAKKTIIRVYTDGGENHSDPKDIRRIASLIQEVKSEGITVSYFGTDDDRSDAVTVLGIDETNTTVYDGSAKGYEMALVETQTATDQFVAKARAGKDVSEGFYVFDM